MVPPPRFGEVTFDSYLPDAAYPSQAAALEHLRSFASTLHTAAIPRRSWRGRGKAAPTSSGVYLDGGFGVGKTHLLAALWREAPAPKAFGTFVGWTNLVGRMGFAQAVEAFSQYRLLCIDEFELDDPGDTVLVSTLLTRLAERGVSLAATSNTLPDRLGEGRFAAEDFLREIQGLAARFTTVRVDGTDYRNRGLPQAPVPSSDADVRATAGPAASLDGFDDLLDHLARVHPSLYGHLVAGVSATHLLEVSAVHDQARALRLVVLADRLYDRDIPVVTSGVPLDQVFAPDLLAGGYRKKYFRAISRLVALARQSDSAASAPTGRIPGPGSVG
ncbi:MAG: cell division protein ZapE [Actinomycetota bacterium]|nr:MAG: cell division protein ZapE [Actinomycetota bacterium]